MNTEAQNRGEIPWYQLFCKKRSFQQGFLLSIWFMYLTSGFLLGAFHVMGTIDVLHIELAEEVRREEEIFRILQRFKTGNT